MALSKKLELACHEYLVDLNWSKAMQRAGYKRSTAKNSGTRYFERVEVQALIDELMDQRKERVKRDGDDVIKELESVAYSNIMDLFESEVEGEGEFNESKSLVLRDLSGLPCSVTAAIRDIKITPASAQAPGKIEIKLHNKLSALEALGRHFQLFEKGADQGIEFHMHMDLGGDSADQA